MYRNNPYKTFIEKYKVSTIVTEFDSIIMEDGNHSTHPDALGNFKISGLDKIANIEEFKQIIFEQCNYDDMLQQLDKDIEIAKAKSAAYHSEHDVINTCNDNHSIANRRIMPPTMVTYDEAEMEALGDYFEKRYGKRPIRVKNEDNRTVEEINEWISNEWKRTSKKNDEYYRNLQEERQKKDRSFSS